MAARADTGDRARDGTLAVSGGRVVVDAADPGGRAPLLDWEDGVTVLIDGLPPVSRPCQVLYGQSVEAWAPVAGHPGCTVRGDLVPVRAPRSVAIEIGENVLVSADGARLVSAIDGFPRVGDGRIDVAPSLRLDRDLDDRTGDLQAYGSLDL